MTPPPRRAGLELTAAQLFRELVDAARLQDRATRQASGLPAAQLRLLAVVRREPGITLSATAVRLALEVPTTSNLVRALADARLLRVVPDPADRRRKLLFPRQAAAKFHTHGVQAQNASGRLQTLLRQLSERELRALNQSLALVAKHIPPPLRRARERR